MMACGDAGAHGNRGGCGRGGAAMRMVNELRIDLVDGLALTRACTISADE